MIEVTEAHADKLIVKFFARLRGWQLDADVVARKAVHGSASRGTLEEHLGLLPDVRGIESLRLLVGKGYQAMGTELLLALVHHIGDAEGTRAWTLRIGKDMELSDRKLVEKREALLE